ncbi:MAG TPA: MoxR family ATPase, partial [Syntrophobacteraceae bacterium]|nr:MoxR family ATPase [Syntrophobacteraceae bacterium]
SLVTFYRLREQGFEKPPATAELLDWVGAMRTSDTKAPGAGKETRHIGTLLKRSQDLLKFKGVQRSGRL